MPIRENGAKDKIWRRFSIGKLINLVMLDTRLYGRDKQLDISSYIKDKILDKENFKKDLLKPRALLGNEQLNWVNKKIDKEFKWSIFGQQLLIGPKYLPGIFKSDKLDSSRSYLSKQLAGEKVPINTDQWDGYPLEREKFYEVISQSQSNVILAGDSHNAWFSNLYDEKNESEYSKFGEIVGMPTTMIYSPEGEFLQTFMGEINMEDLEKIIPL